MLKFKTKSFKRLFIRNTGAGGQIQFKTAAAQAPSGPEPPGTASFSYQGEYATTWTVPTGVTTIDVRAWGAGGGVFLNTSLSDHTNNVRGGSGGFTCATVNVTPGETLYIVVGNGGSKAIRAGAGRLGGWPGGGTGSIGTSTDFRGAGGGGYTGIFSSAGISHANALVIAGAGGGSDANSINGWPGGGLSGAGRSVADANGLGAGSTNTPIGGTQSAGGGGYSGGALSTHGVSGSALQGGNAGTGNLYGGGGAGAGYYGGGGGGLSAAGAGGSSYYGAAAVVTGTTFIGFRSNLVWGSLSPPLSPSGHLPPFHSDPVYILATASYGKIGMGGYGSGSLGDGRPGFIHIKWPGGQGFKDGHFDRPLPVTPGIANVTTFGVDGSCRKSGTSSNGPGDYVRFFTFSVEPNKTVDVYVGPTAANTCLAVFTGSVKADVAAGKLVGSNTLSTGSDGYMSWSSRVTFNTNGAAATRNYIAHAGTEVANTVAYDLKFRVVTS